jgi:glucosamine--fructose-6-phosphate aminotransferase (isomerizing)
MATLGDAFGSALAVPRVWAAIVENYRQLKDELIARGHQFRSETDTEVIAHLVEERLNGDFCEAVRQALMLLEGTYGLAIISSRWEVFLVFPQ